MFSVLVFVAFEIYNQREFDEWKHQMKFIKQKFEKDREMANK
jgi:hypothetical protein